jgi:uncharacterized protein YdhG (YjbR/CyaY superfamily)
MKPHNGHEYEESCGVVGFCRSDYFATFKNHLGIYPPVTEDAALIAELSRFRNEKGNLIFKFKEPIPYELIARAAAALARQYSRQE